MPPTQPIRRSNRYARALQAYVDRNAAYRKQAAQAAEQVPGKATAPTGAEASVREAAERPGGRDEDQAAAQTRSQAIFSATAPDGDPQSVDDAFDGPRKHDLLMDALAEQNDAGKASPQKCPSTSTPTRRACRRCSIGSAAGAAEAARIRFRRPHAAAARRGRGRRRRLPARTRCRSCRRRACRRRAARSRERRKVAAADAEDSRRHRVRADGRQRIGRHAAEGRRAVDAHLLQRRRAAFRSC